MKTDIESRLEIFSSKLRELETFLTTVLAAAAEVDDVCVTTHLYMPTGGGGSEGKEMRCEKCGKTKSVPWR